MATFLYLQLGFSIYYAESVERIADNLREVQPHVFTTVPRLLEKIYDKIVATGQQLTGLKRKLFFWALDLGLRYDTQQDQGAWYNAQLALANKLVFSKWRAALGGQVRYIVSGGGGPAAAAGAGVLGRRHPGDGGLRHDGNLARYCRQPARARGQPHRDRGAGAAGRGSENCRRR